MRDYVELDDAGLSSDLVTRLRSLERWVPPEEMGEVWIFPPLERPEGTREFLLFTRMAGDGERAVYSARGRREGAAEAAGDAPGNGAAAAAAGPRPATNGSAPAAGPAGENGANGSHAPAAEQAVVEHGRAPAGRLPDLVERLLRRLGDDRAPVHVGIEGSAERWEELVDRLSEDAGAETPLAS